MLTTRTSRWSALTALLCVAMLAAAWLLLVSPRLGRAGEIRAEAEGKRAQNEALELKVAQLRAQFAELPKSQAELAEIYAQMPVDAAMPALVRTVDAAATGSGVTLKSVTPSAAGVLEQATAAAQASPGPTGSAAASGGAESSGGGSGTTTTPAQAGTRVVVIPVTIVSEGEYFQQVLFLKKLQAEMTRLLAVSNLQLAVTSDAQDASASGVTMTIAGKVFALPDAEAATTSAEATAGTPAAGAAASPASATQAPATPAGGSNS